MLSTTPRTTLGRSKDRGSSDRNDLYEVLDAGLICHLGVVVDGHPMVVPTGYGRLGETLYLHGSTGARSLRASEGTDVCVTVTHLDGIVLALSLEEASVKMRRGGPLDEEEDYELPVWAGVLPLVTSWGEPLPDPALPEGIDVPVHIRGRR